MGMSKKVNSSRMADRKGTAAPPTAIAAAALSTMARAVPYSPLATYTVIPLTSSLPEDEYSFKAVVDNPVQLGKVFLAVIITLMIVSTILGNSLVCLAVFLVRKLQQPANYLIVSLAVADCLVGLLVMPLALVDLLFEEWPLGSSWCKLWTTADLTLCTASIVNLCMISVDRYRVISSPLRYAVQRTSKRMIIYIAIVWTVSALVSLSSHIIVKLLYEDDPSQNGCQVIDHFAYQIYATIISFYGPTIIMVILYVKIWRAAKRIAKQDRSLSCNGADLDKNGSEVSDLLEKKRQSDQSGKPRLSGSKLFRGDRKYLHRPSALLQAVKLKHHTDGQDCKARKTLGVIMSVFIICWLPFFVFAILKSCFGVQIPYWLDTLALWLGYSNSTLNPAIYCKYNKEFRVPFREILSCRCGTLQMVLRQQSFTSRYGAPIRMRLTSSSGVTPLLARRPSSHPECSDV